ncbi:hypothetical protein [Spartinivicinus ruber]|uniref:hypothetical protein n=1 Tax=Spartinivicinus ruber TaxID=2683272 RepID=UPI001CA38E59|nr:hypothetical protein [Spartinivicinus ruber]
MPFKHWRFEQYLSEKASVLSFPRPAYVHCNSPLDAIFDNSVRRAGHANPMTGEIVFQYPWCYDLMDYLDSPGSATEKELFSMHMFTHESMHVRGELNEQKTDCQAIQRDYIAGKLLGVPDHVAKRNALIYYEKYYVKHPYFSKQCAPEKNLDEKLNDSTWSELYQKK